MSESDRRIAALLHDVSSVVEFPETPPLASLVRNRIEKGPVPVGRIALPRTRPPLWQPALAASSVLVLVLGLTLALSATARHAVADLLGVVGIHVTFDDEAVPAAPPRSPLELGERMSVREVRELSGFDVRSPSGPGFPRVAAAYYDPTIGAGGMVSLVYPADATTTSEVDLLVTQFVASVDEGFFKKLAQNGADVIYTEVRSTMGFWVGGDPHLFWYVDADGRARPESVRLAGRVLLWEEGGITYRVEGARSLPAALRIAERLR